MRLESASGAVIKCIHCGKIHRYGEWVEPPVELTYQINSGEIEELPRTCPLCQEEEAICAEAGRQGAISAV